MRGLSEKFLHDLKDNNGLLHPILERVRKDDTLMLAIRNNYINVYYRGGNLLRIKEQGNRSYNAFFDDQYNKSDKIISIPADTIKSQDDAKRWIGGFPVLKEVMDYSFSKNSKPEREFQQLVARENNFSTISNETEYFVLDIEVANSDLEARFDLLALRWPASKRQSGNSCRAALIEMKYGDGAIRGNSGMLEHLKDIDDFVSDRTRYSELLYTMEAQFNQLDQLGLLNFEHSKNGIQVKLNTEDKPEVIFLLANHNPRSTKLNSILNTPAIDEYNRSGRFDLKFCVASFAGYGLHTDCMVSLIQLRQFLKK